MMLFEYHPVLGTDTLDIRLTIQLSPDEQKSAISAASPEAYFTRLFAHDASLLPRTYILTRCEAAPHGDGSQSVWDVLASAKRKKLVVCGN